MLHAWFNIPSIMRYLIYVNPGGFVSAKFDLDLLSKDVQNKIESDKMSVRKAAKEIGFGASTLGRIVQGSKAPNVPEWANLMKTIEWLGASPSEYEIGVRRPSGSSTLTDVEVHLRALPNLTKMDTEALVAMVKGAYDQAKKSRKKKR